VGTGEEKNREAAGNGSPPCFAAFFRTRRTSFFKIRCHPRRELRIIKCLADEPGGTQKTSGTAGTQKEE
jgi:hypothetical protein